MKAKNFIWFIGLIIAWAILLTSGFAQSAADCTVTAKGDNNLIIVSCPDGNRTVDAGGRVDLYRVGDRVDVYGVSGNQPATLPGQTPILGR
jgi:hypothetical protein